jgi:short-subunit dehydrogenase
MTRHNILITGASSGLGAGMARLFAAQGRNLALCARRIDALDTLKAELLAAHPNIRVEVRALDVNDHDAVFATFRDLDAALGGLDRIIVNAGMGKGAGLGTGQFAANRDTAMTNFVAALAQCEAALELFRPRNAGHLVMISSFSAYRGFPRAMTTYAATKAAVANLAEGMRAELLDSPITVSTICPGYIDSDINRHVKNRPFVVDTETGCRALVAAIEREPATANVPRWPWSALAAIVGVAPLSVIAKMS